MSFFPQFGRWLGRRGQRRPLTPIRRVRHRPALEVLETRNLLSTLTVTNLLDTGVSGDGSLRGEIAAAASGDQIVFADSLAGQTITLNAANGRLALNKDLTIQGPGADELTVSGNNATGVFNIAAGATDTITGLTIADGQDGVHGGGIVNHGTLMLDNCTLSGNHVVGDMAGGGGIFNDGTLTLDHSTLSDNHSHATGFVGYGEGGGGIDNHGTLTIHYSTLSGNTAPSDQLFGLGGQGGGIFNRGTLTLDHSTLSDNHAGNGDSGGGIANSGTAAVTNSTLSDNHAGNGGGIFNDNHGTVTVTNSTLSGNQADRFGAGGGIWNDGTATVTNSTLSGNTASGSGADFGGGIFNSGTLTLDSSTLSDNQAANGGGIFNLGGGTVTVTSSTIAGNVATRGGGIANFGTLSAGNNILAGNSAANGPDLEGALSSQGYNLIGNTQGGSGFAASDLLNVDPLLGPLQDNGGPTQTMAVLAGSPALNAGDPAQLGVADQRGVVRSGGVNIGAYQASASALVLTAPATATAGTAFDLAVQAVDPFGQTAVGYTGTVTFSSSDGEAVLPGDYSFTAADAGMHTFARATTLFSAGSQTVTATDTGTAALTGSASVWVNPAAADHLLFLQGPTDTAAGQTLSPVVLAVVDAFGNVVTGDTCDPVTLSLGVNPAGGTLSGTLTVTVTNGVATFSDLSIDMAGSGYTLHASIGGSQPDIDSNPFTIT
jgi:hypothetical protein